MQPQLGIWNRFIRSLLVEGADVYMCVCVGVCVGVCECVGDVQQVWERCV